MRNKCNSNWSAHHVDGECENLKKIACDRGEDNARSENCQKFGARKEIEKECVKLHGAI